MSKRFALIIVGCIVLGLNGCDEDSADFVQPQCPAGTFLDTVSGNCVPESVNNCKEGSGFDDNRGECVPFCREGQISSESEPCICPKGQEPDDVKGCREKCDDDKRYDDVRGACVSICREGQISSESEPCICPKGQEPDDVKGCREKCDDDKRYDDVRGACLPICREGQISSESEPCVCPDGQEPDDVKGCREKCDDDKRYDDLRGACLPICRDGQISSESETCVCPDGQRLNDNNVCELSCAEDEHYDSSKNRCVKTHCELGKYLDSESGKCFKVCPCDQEYSVDDDDCKDSYIPDDKALKVKALQETALAFYRKGPNIQYDTPRRTQEMTPEDVTSQHIAFTVCSGYVYSVFRQALGIALPEWSDFYAVYGYCLNKDDKCSNSHIDDTSDIVAFYGQSVIDAPTTTDDNGPVNQNIDRVKFGEFVKYLEPGDVISYYYSNYGHVVFVYDVDLDADGNVVDAYILHSLDSFEDSLYRSTKLKDSLSWYDNISDESLIDAEGTVRYTRLKKHMCKNENLDVNHLCTEDIDNDGCVLTDKGITHLIVLRPTNKAEYCKMDVSKNNAEKPNFDKMSISASNSDCHDSMITSSAYCRIRYPKMDVEKTVDVHEGNTVEPGGRLTYSIKVTNNSNEFYKDLYVREDVSKYIDEVIDADGGTIYDNNSADGEFNRTIAWHIPAILAGASHTINYTVRVNNDAPLNRAIHSKGTVADIPTREIENVVAYSLSEEDVEHLKYDYINGEGDSLNRLKNAYAKVGIDVGVSSDIVSLGKIDYSGKVLCIEDKNRDTDKEKCENGVYDGDLPYANVNDALFNVKYKNVKSLTVDDNVLSKMILNHYYSATYSAYYVGKDAKEKYTIYTDSAETMWLVDGNGKSVNRSTMVYPDTLRDGDILIYTNKYDNAKTSSGNEPGINSVLWISDDDGTYAFLFYDGAFHLIDNRLEREFKLKTDVDGYYGNVKEYCYIGAVPSENHSASHYCGNNRTYKGPNEVCARYCSGNPEYNNCKFTTTIERWYKKVGVKANDDFPLKQYCTSDQAKMLDRFGDLPSLYGKDFFVILRPSLLKTSK